MSAPQTIEARLAQLEKLVAELQVVTATSRQDYDVVASILRTLPATLTGVEFTLDELADHYRARNLPLPASTKAIGKAFLKYSGIVIDGAIIHSVRRSRQNHWIVRRLKPAGPTMLFV